ncbi:MAG: hypothetical protein KGJ02_02190 [Verrucomicrobiota bacterium]|nr:hypothetical protein [Verrucomicrobiota bacterium]
MSKMTAALIAALNCCCLAVYADEAETAPEAEVVVSTETTTEENTAKLRLWNDETTATETATNTTNTGSSGCGCGKPKQ